MTPMINTDELMDAQGVADLVGLRHANSVHTYLRRYADMPRPVIDLGPGRSRLWLRPEIEAWMTIRTGTAPVTVQVADLVVDQAAKQAANRVAN